MNVTLRHPDDLNELRRRAKGERDADQHNRYRAVILALEGEATKTIMKMLGVARTFVQDWVYRYRDGGVDALVRKKPPGAKPKLPRDQEEPFRQRMLGGPTEADGVCTLRGLDAVRILEEEFGVKYTLEGAYNLLHRLGLRPLRPRPSHPKADPEAQRQWLEAAPLLSGTSSKSTRTRRSRSGSRTKRGSVKKGR